MPPLSTEEYQVGWVCALPKELTAARSMLDEEHEEMKSQAAGDDNSYVLGRIHAHNVVLACLPAWVYGTVSAATVAVNMLRTFTSIRFGLMVGIGGGIPNLSKEVDIRLGDVVVSQPSGAHGGVVQFDLGKNLGGTMFERTGSLRTPPKVLLTGLANLQSQHMIYGHRISVILSDVHKRLPRLAKMGYVHPGSQLDQLYCSYVDTHQEGGSCIQCTAGRIERQPRDDQTPEVHYGVIASGNQLLKNAIERHRLGLELGAKCVEMEAAGLMTDFPCIVVRGICDYADSHKNDRWQEYAAVTAAAFAKELLATIKPAGITSTKHAVQASDESREIILNARQEFYLGLNLFNAPDLSESLFIGRDRELEQMRTILQPQMNTSDTIRRVLVLGGMGGIGKTQLAIVYAKRYRSSYSSIFWLDATSEARLKMSIWSAANRIFPDTVNSLMDDQVHVRMSNWLSEPQNTGWLLIYDNHDDPDQYDIAKYYPSSFSGSIIITTRQPRCLNGEKIMLRSIAEEDDSLGILAARSERTSVVSDLAAHQLARRLNGYPLALATAGAFLKESSISFSKYLQQYEAEWEVIGDCHEELPDYPTRTLYTTWNVSLARIKEQNPQAVELLRLMAYLDCKDIWYELLSASSTEGSPSRVADLIGDEFSFEKAMMSLTRYCLVEAHPEKGSYSLHMCVHDWTFNCLNRQIDADDYWLVADSVAHCIDQVGATDYGTLDYRRYVPHARRLAHARFHDAFRQQGLTRQKPDQITILAKLLRKHYYYDEAERMYLWILAESEKLLGQRDRSTLATLTSLGILYARQGKLKMAERMYKRVVGDFGVLLDHNRGAVLTAALNLANLWKGNGRIDEAEKVYLWAMLEWGKGSRFDPRSMFHITAGLADISLRRGKLDEAERMYSHALPLSEIYGVDSTESIKTTLHLEILYSRQKKSEAAEQMYKRALAGCEKYFGPDHVDTLTVVLNLGTLYYERKELDAAEEMFRRVLKGFGSNPVMAHLLPQIVDANGLGTVYGAQSEREVLEVIQGKRHPFTLLVLSNLGEVLKDQGKLGEAEELLLRAQQGYEDNSLSGSILSLANTYYLGRVRRKQGRLHEAKQLFRRVLSGREKSSRPDDEIFPDAAEALKELSVADEDGTVVAPKGP